MPGIGFCKGSGQRMFKPGRLGCLRQLPAASVSLSQTSAKERSSRGERAGIARQPRPVRVDQGNTLREARHTRGWTVLAKAGGAKEERAVGWIYRATGEGRAGSLGRSNR